MRSVSASVAVDRPIQDVFSFLADGRNNPAWRPDVSVVARITGSGLPLGAGTTFHQRVTDSAGRTTEEDYEITRYEPPHVLEFTTTRGTARIVGRYTLAFINSQTTHVEFSLWRVSHEFRRVARVESRSQLADRVEAISRVPAAMKDQGAPLL